MLQLHVSAVVNTTIIDIAVDAQQLRELQPQMKATQFLQRSASTCLTLQLSFLREKAHLHAVSAAFRSFTISGASDAVATEALKKATTTTLCCALCGEALEELPFLAAFNDCCRQQGQPR